MLDILHPYFNIGKFGSKTKLRRQNKPNHIRRDYFDKKKSKNKLNKRDNKVPAEAIVPLLEKEKELERESHQFLGGEEREGIKVKILMTKEDAARLLLKCRDGGVLEFRDVARELVQIPASRVSAVSSVKWEDRVLGSIPEES
ncbi:hypothetical protein RHSIM_Rhsim02G0243700 [Rhododendron simsii]|uniref:DUF7890 domain-containing protein n=1 Tax=Rhododendron simsii TaxID=118357 RepID=A0A834HBQ3_RHOSS|nr:hypothetical protein RHSIM_Rhsim02G0243700 [Rhododendron simsii]